MLIVLFVFFLLELGLLVLDGDVGASGGLPLLADEVGDLLVLGLLNGGLVVLRALTHESLLDKVDTCWCISTGRVEVSKSVVSLPLSR
jgi:hypothetical protein